jgi:hypothetical protein
MTSRNIYIYIYIYMPTYTAAASVILSLQSEIVTLFTNSVFCPHNIFVCFICFCNKQRYNSIFVIEGRSVYTEAGSEILRNMC